MCSTCSKQNKINTRVLVFSFLFDIFIINTTNEIIVEPEATQRNLTTVTATHKKKLIKKMVCCWWAGQIGTIKEWTSTNRAKLTSSNYKWKPCWSGKCSSILESLFNVLTSRFCNMLAKVKLCKLAWLSPVLTSTFSFVLPRKSPWTSSTCIPRIRSIPLHAFTYVYLKNRSKLCSRMSF